MKNITECINEGVSGFEVHQSLSNPRAIASIPVKRGADFLYINPDIDVMVLCTMAEVIDSFEGEETDIKAIKKLEYGESYCPDGSSIYTKIN